jgi:TPR repeat protein
MYVMGDGVQVDIAEGIRWWRAAADRGNPQAQFSLAHELHTGKNVPRDVETAVMLLARSADGGFAPAARTLGAIYHNGDGVERNEADALKWFAKAWQNGDVTAALYASAATDRERNYAESARILRSAAERGNPRAQAMLGQRYQQGLGLARDDAEALRLYRLAADQGDSWGRFMLGEAHGMGLAGLTPDRFEAAAWYTRAAEQGLAAAQSRLGLVLATGGLAVPDATTAVKWFRLAAEQEYPEAMNALGYSLDMGDGSPRDPNEAMTWFRRAAAYGNPLSCHSIAGHYIRGDVVPLDLAEAYYWVLLAQRFYQESDTLKRNQVAALKRQIEPKLDDAAKTTAEARARNFVPLPLPTLDGARQTQYRPTP